MKGKRFAEEQIVKVLKQAEGGAAASLGDLSPREYASKMTG